MFNFIYNDNEYMNIINEILNHEEFLKLKEIPHHGTNRFNHCLRVSYESYKIAKEKNLDYISVARGALLHDFFFENTRLMTTKQQKENLQTHPYQAYKNALKYFSINKIEKDIIIKHMYPITRKMPKYRESFLVCRIDKKIANSEVVHTRIFNKRYINRFALFVLLLSSVI